MFAVRPMKSARQTFWRTAINRFPVVSTFAACVDVIESV
jgi:hypothetical protein